MNTMEAKSFAQDKDDILQPDHVASLKVCKEGVSNAANILNRRTGRVVKLASKKAQLLTSKYPEDFKPYNYDQEEYNKARDVS